MSDGFDAYKEWLGIGPDEQPPNHYRLLDLQEFEDLPGLIEEAVAKRTELLKTYQLSPQSDKCQDLLNEVAAASVCLLNRDKKAVYDEQLRFGMVPEIASTTPTKKASKKASKKAHKKAPGVLGPARPKKGRKKYTEREIFARLAIKFGIGFVVLLVCVGLTAALIGLGGGKVGDAVLVLDWPEDEREHVALEVNGKTVSIPATGPFKSRGKPGTYQVVATRPGFNTFRRTVFIEGGQTSKIRLKWRASGATPLAASDPAEMPISDPAAEDPGMQPPAEGGLMEPKPPIADSRALPEDVQQRLQNSVVRVVLTGLETPRQPAVGFVVDAAGVIATSYRAIEGASGAQVVFRERLPSEVVGYVAVDKGRDLVLLRLRDSGLTAPGIAGDAPALGDPLTALGPPDLADSQTQGIANAFRRGEIVRSLLEAGGAADTDLLAALDPEATWIETTATISSQQNGSPLVNAQGEVVGMCVWMGASQLAVGFALDGREILQLLRAGSDESQPLSSLAKATKTVPKEPDEPDGPVEIVLGSGRVFRWEEFNIDGNATAAVLSGGASQSVVEVMHGSLFHIGYARHRKGDLNGLTVLFHDEEMPMLYVNYSDNKRTGLLKLWDESGDERYFSEWSENKRNGVCCLLEDDEPHLICECVEDEYASITLLSHDKEIKQFKNEQEARENDLANDALEAITDVENTIKDLHNHLGRNVRKEANKGDYQAKRKLASSQGVAKRAAAMGRINARGASRQMGIQGTRRASGVY